MPTADQVRSRVQAYLDAFNTDSRDAFLDCFAPDAVQRDPVTAPPNVGLEAIGAFWDNVHAMADSVSLEAHHVHVCGDEAAMVFTITSKIGDGGVQIEAVDLFHIDGDGKIDDFRAYWDPSAMKSL